MKTPYKKTFPYNLRRALPVLGIAMAGLFMSSCNQDDDTPTRDIDLPFWESMCDTDISNLDMDLIKSYAKDPTVRNIYLHVTDKNDYNDSHTQGFKNMRNFLQQRLDISPKIHGRGNFKFNPGQVERDDSLWFVSKGWTINQHLTKQK